ncbi:MAG: potassium transporter TrkG, partial [Oscillospiraceae bacterium]|nr:potassium transporter TrkG [Oscillospiraceae bacterium]
MPFWKNDRITPAQIIILGFLSLITVGTVLLMLPFSTNGPGGAPFLDALFTATSATCVTGLVVQDTALYWSPFGQAIILVLIQIGGMGVVTMAVAIFIFTGRHIS